MQESAHELSSGMASQSIVPMSTSAYNTVSRFLPTDNVTYVYATMATDDETECQPELASSNSAESGFDSVQAEHALDDLSQNIGSVDTAIQVVKSSVEACKSPGSINDERGLF